MPNKLFEMSFADIPILSNELDEIAEFLAELGNGTTVDIERRERIHYSLAKLLTEKQNYGLSEQSRLRLQQAYSWEAQAAKLCTIYSRLLIGVIAAKAPGP
jgi:glycosyltransferase involved in cell wall biosynthesis